VDFLSDVVGDVVSEVVAGKASKGLRRVLGRRGPADGSADCALKIIRGKSGRLVAALAASLAYRISEHPLTLVGGVLIDQRGEPRGRLARRARQLADADDGAGDHVRQDPQAHLEADAG
jgi:hypothetical protein